MSKGGAGKVYFVLYLAVILELLIIFIERDEAEENLRKQQQEAIQIVQTILSQLQTGSGASGITVNPKDQIVLDPDNAKNVRNYEAKVSVGDPKAVFEYNGKKVKGDDIPKLEYIVSHIADETKPEEELGADTADLLGDPGTVFFKAELGMDVEGYTTPRQTFGGSIPAPGDVPYFTLNETRTQEEIAKGNRQATDRCCQRRLRWLRRSSCHCCHHCRQGSQSSPHRSASGHVRPELPSVLR